VVISGSGETVFMAHEDILKRTPDIKVPWNPEGGCHERDCWKRSCP
jgi:hypothetical protein